MSCLTRSQRDRDGVPLGAEKSGNTGGNNSDFTRSEITSISMRYAHLRLPTKKRHKTGFKVITSGVVSLIMVFLPSPSQLKEVLDKGTLFPLLCLLWV